MNAARKLLHEEVSIWIDKDGILRVHFNEGVEMDLDMAEILLQKYRELGMGPGKEKRLEIMTTDGFLTISKDARAYIAFHGKEYFIAAAMVNNTLAIRLLVNFFNSFYKHNVPFKMFPTEEKALKWLKTFKKRE